MLLFDTLTFCFEHFYGMDRANAAVHCAVVRFSPITFRLAEAVVEEQARRDSPILLGVTQEAIAEVLAHRGAYEEDKGR
jgi:hypothetical protein